jgi:ATP-dependent HslUV protease subunit HslV
MKGTANKLRLLAKGKIIGGFAGAAADGFTLFERLEAKLESHPGQLTRAAVELAKDWRSDKYLRKLEAMMIVCDKDHMLVVSGNGDVLEPEYETVAIGSGSNYALAAARALLEKSDLSAEEIARTAMKIAGDMCIYTNHNLVVQKIGENEESL